MRKKDENPTTTASQPVVVESRRKPSSHRMRSSSSPKRRPRISASAHRPLSTAKRAMFATIFSAASATRDETAGAIPSAFSVTSLQA